MHVEFISKRKYFVIMTILILVTSLLVGMMVSSPIGINENQGEQRIIFVTFTHEKERTFLNEMDLNMIDTYGDSALVEIEESKISTLKGNGLSVDELPSRTELSVKGHTFDIAEEPELDSRLSIENYEKGEEGIYIVHMLGPVNPEWREKLEKMNAHVINYVPNYAYEVRMTPELAEKVEELFFVDWVGIYQPDYKISSSLSSMNEDRLTVDVRLAPGSSQRSIDQVKSNFAVNRSLDLGTRGHRFILEVSGTKEVESLAMINDVYYISRYREPELHSEVDSQIIGGGAWIMDDEHDDIHHPYRKHGDYGAYINQIGYSGKGVVIAVADTGIGNGTLGDSGHPDLTGRVIGGYGFEDLDDDDWVDGHGHGTHVTGSAAGDTYGAIGEKGGYPGYAPYLMAQGLAYDSELYSAKVFDPGWLGADFYEIVEIPKQEADAYIHTNSWGSNTEGEYIESDSIYDQAVRNADRNTTGNQPMVITVSAGNDGRRGNQSTGSPGNAKNVITVGATESFMPDGSYFGGRDTDDPYEVASFSSRGWTEDNRIKPDVVAPGENVLSLGNPNRNVGGTYEWKSGTSMSCPAVAGASAVVVEWYEKNHGERPSPAMVKSLLINTAEDPAQENCRHEYVPNKDVGWGMVDISKLEYPKEDPIPFMLEDQNSLLETGEKNVYEVEPESKEEPFKISLVWTDKEAEEGDNPTLKNDLNLEVISPSGEKYVGNSFERGWTRADQRTIKDFDTNGDGYDDVNNVQNVFIHPDNVEEGTYTVRVIGKNIPADANNDGTPNQDYALTVYNAAVPSPELTSPSPGETLRDEDIAVEWDTEKNVSSKIRLNGENWIETGYNNTYVFEGLSDQKHRVDVITTDENGRRGRDFVEFFVDTTPYIEIISPKENEVIREKEVKVQWLSYNIDSHEVKLDGNYQYVGEETSFTFRDLDDRDYTVEIRGLADEVNSTKSVNFSVDTSTYVEIISPEKGEVFGSSDLKIEWISDYVDYHEIKIGDDDWVNVYTDNSYLFEGVDGGRHTIKVRAVGENEVVDSIDIIYYKRRDPMEIQGDQEFEEKAEKNDWHGDGTQDQPYIIEWYDIDGGGKRSGIHIKNVTSHFVVRNSRLYNANRTTPQDAGNSGIYLYETMNGEIYDNEVKSNSYGIRLDRSENNVIINNTCINNHAGIYLSNSNNNVIRENNVSKFRYPTYGEGILLEDSNRNELSDNHGVNNNEGILLDSSDHNTLFNNNHSYNSVGIRLDDSDDNSLEQNSLSSNSHGIYTRRSSQNDISHNNLSKNSYGFFLSSSELNRLSENRLIDNYYGLRISSSSDENEIEDNKIADSVSYGIYLFSSENNKFMSNELVENGVFLGGQTVEHWNTHSMDESNTINDMPILYLKDEDGKTISRETGQVILANSTNIVVEQQNIDEGDVGILLGFSDDNTIRDNVIRDQIQSITLRHSHGNEIRNNTLFNNTAGIYMANSDRNTVVENNVSENIWPGIYLSSSDKNLIFGNSISHNDPQLFYGIYLTRSTNNTVYHNEIYNQDFPEDYEGQAFDNTNNSWDHDSEGNYWSDYTYRYPHASEIDGVWNRSYEIAGDGNRDRYPLTSPEKVGDLSVRFLKPIDDETIFSPDVTARWNTKGGQGEIDYRIRLDEEGWIEPDETTSHTFEDLEDGEYILEIEAEDEEGTVSSHRVTFSVHRGIYVEIISPEDDEIIRRSRASIEWFSKNHNNTEIRLRGPIEKDWEDVGRETEHTYTGLDDGKYTVEVRSIDEEGEKDHDEVSFLIKTVSVEITSPEDNEIIKGDTVEIRWTSENAEYHEIQICGGRWDYIGNVTEYEVSGLEEGEYELSIRAVDESGRRARDTITFTVELPAAEVNIINPKDGAIFDRDYISIEWQIQLLNEVFEVEYYEIRLDGIQWKSVGNVTEYTFEDLENGEHTIEVRAVDDLGYFAKDHIIIFVDTVPPEVRITYPTDRDLLDTSEVSVEWEGKDDVSGIDYYEVRIDKENDGDWINVGLDTSYPFDGLEDGQYTVEVRVYDRAGNVAMDSVSFEVEVAEPPYLLWSLFTLIIVVLFIISARVGFVILKRRKKEAPRKTLRDLETEHGVVKYGRYEKKYKL